MDEEWSEWIEHDGGACPCVGKYIHAVFRHDPWGPAEVIGIAMGGLGWFWDNGFPDITRYRIRKPLGLTILQQIAADPQSVREDA